MLGAAVHYESLEDDDTALPDVEFTSLTFDASLESGSWNVFGSFSWTGVDNPVAISDQDMLGFVGQGGYAFNEDWDVFLRYEWADIDTAGSDDVSILTLGFNRYFAEHHAKWTTDVGVSFDSLDGSQVAGITGYRIDSPNEDGQVVVRTQLQILF
jgi:hypothetical protein